MLLNKKNTPLFALLLGLALLLVAFYDRTDPLLSVWGTNLLFFPAPLLAPLINRLFASPEQQTLFGLLATTTLTIVFWRLLAAALKPRDHDK